MSEKFLRKRTIVLLVIIILGLTVFGLVLSSIEPSSSSLLPGRSKVEATAWWQPNPNGPELRMEITLVELDVDNVYYLRDVILNPHDGKNEAYAVFGPMGIRVSKGDVIQVTFHSFSSNFQLRNVNRVDVVLPFYDMERVVMRTPQGATVRERLRGIGEIEFSVEVKGESPSEWKQ